MKRSARSAARIGLWIVLSFFAGTLCGMLLMTGFRGSSVFDRPAPTAPLVEKAAAIASAPVDGAVATQPPASVRPRVSPPDLDDAIDDLRDRKLLVPVQGITRDMLRDSFSEARDKIREHEAVDILAPRRTPVLAVEDGTIVKFFTSVRGGITIYQFDPSQTYAYYYAHLDGYAPGLAEGDRVTRGQAIGYVGTTGNAPENTPHLHFQIFVLTDQKEWWKGTAVNPYDVWKKD